MRCSRFNWSLLTLVKNVVPTICLDIYFYIANKTSRSAPADPCPIMPKGVRRNPLSAVSMCHIPALIIFIFFVSVSKQAYLHIGQNENFMV